MLLKNDHFALSNFEGTLDFLVCLLQKEEIDIYDIPIQEIVDQFIYKLTEMEKGQLDRGAEFIATTSYLVWLKSKMLLPQNELTLEIEEGLEDPHFEIIHHLVDYCHFKRATKELVKQQDKQTSLYFRGVDIPDWKKPLGIDHVSLQDLSQLFHEMVERARENRFAIEEENWRVCDKIVWIREELQRQPTFILKDLFHLGQTRLELIVTFLAILELMKIGDLAIYREPEENRLMITKKQKQSA